MVRLIAGFFTAFVILVGLAACEPEGPAERAGEQMDEAADNVGDAADNASDEIDEEF